MLLYLMRHGQASAKPIDPGLSTEGQAQINKLGIFLKNAHFVTDQIFHSGKKRAQQTAQIIAENIGFQTAIQISTSLDPNAEVQLLLDNLILTASPRSSILLVSHMPLISKLASMLLVNDENRDVALFQPGTILALEKMSDIWVSKWMLSTELFK